VADQLVDTNVLIVASASSDRGEQYGDVSVGPDDIQRVVDWLSAFGDDPSRKMVLDDLFKIWEEYNHKLTAQHFGLQVIHRKMTECLSIVPVEYDEHGHGKLPLALDKIDKSDKKFVAAALNDPSNIHIVNACDSDWNEHKVALHAHGIVVVELLR
jgi:hypothetical protein